MMHGQKIIKSHYLFDLSPCDHLRLTSELRSGQRYWCWKQLSVPPRREVTLVGIIQSCNPREEGKC